MSHFVELRVCEVDDDGEFEGETPWLLRVPVVIKRGWDGTPVMDPEFDWAGARVVRALGE